MNGWRTAGWGALLLYTLALFWTASDYGVTWDEPGWFRVGDRHLAFFRSLDFSQIAPRPGPWGWEAYGPHAAIVSAGISHLTHSLLGWADPDTGRHVGNTLFALLAAFALWNLTQRRDGYRVAFFALLGLATLPRWFGHAHNNPSDMPAAAWVIAAFAFAVAYGKTGGRPYILGVGAALGAAAAVRPQTAILAPIVLIGWVAIEPAFREQLRRRVTDLLLAFTAGAISLFLLWPMLWSDPIGHGLHVLDFFLSPPPWQGQTGLFYLGEQYTTSPPWHYPFVMTAVTTPLPVLCLAAWGIFGSWKKPVAIRKSMWMAAWWAFASIGVHALMSRGNYDGVRHFLEGFGGLVWLAGIGASDLVERARGLDWRSGSRRMGEQIGTALCLLAFLPGAVGIILLHPYPQIYYNLAVGGTQGAASLFEVDYWGFSWKQGTAWVSDKAPPGAVILTPWLEGVSGHYLSAEHDVTWVKQPREIENRRLAAVRRGQAVYFLFPLRQGLVLGDPAIEYVRSRYPRVHQETKAGVPLLEIYRVH